MVVEGEGSRGSNKAGEENTSVEDKLVRVRAGDEDWGLRTVQYWSRQGIKTVREGEV